MVSISYVDFDLPYFYSNKDYPLGGTAVEWSNWIEGLVDNNVNVNLISFQGAKKTVSSNVNFEIIEAYKLDKGIPVLRNFYYRFPMLLRAIKKSNSKYIFQQNAGILSGLTALSCFFLGKKFIYRVGSDIDSTNDVKKKLGFIANIMFRFALNRATLILCQNDYQMVNLSKRFSEDKLRKIYNPIKINYSKKNTYTNSSNQVAWIGNFRPVKNIHKIIPIAKQFSELKFKIAGLEFKNMDKFVKQSIDELKRIDNVEFLGYLNRNQIQSLLSSSKFLINTSEYEGLSNTFLESLSAGTPIVSSKNANPDEIITKNNLGIIVNNDEEYITAIQSINDLIDYDTIEYRAKKFVSVNFEIQIQAKKIIEFLNQI